MNEFKMYAFPKTVDQSQSYNIASRLGRVVCNGGEWLIVKDGFLTLVTDAKRVAKWRVDKILDTVKGAIAML